MITRHPASRTLIIHPMGDLDALQADHYRRQLRALLQEGYRFLIFDLQDTHFINSSGLGLLVEFYKSVTQLDGSLKLLNSNSNILDLLRHSHLDRILLEPDPAIPPVPTTIPEPPGYDSLHVLMDEEILLFSRIHEVTEQILILDDIEEIGKVILQGAIDLLQAQAGAFYLLNEASTNLRLAHITSQRQAQPQDKTQAIYLGPNEPEYQLCLQDDVGWHERTGGDEATERMLSRLGFNAALAAPVHGLRRRYGLLVIEAAPETGEILPIARQLMRTMTSVCGLALEKALLTRQLRERNAELNRAIGQAQSYRKSLIDAGQLAAFGVVFGGLSHLINNKMAPLLGYTQLLSQNEDLSAWANDKLNKLYESTTEVNGVARKLTHLTHPPQRTRRPFDQHELLRPMVDLLSSEIERLGITVHVHAAPDVPAIPGEQDTLLQALLAILHRACSSFEKQPTEGRWIKISTATTEWHLRFIIEDNGADFDDYDRMDQLDPLVPFEAMEHGRLFNYVIPANIARHHGGALRLEPRAEGGKRVILDLPMLQSAPEPVIPAYMRG